MIKIPISWYKTTSFSTLWYITAKADSYALGGVLSAFVMIIYFFAPYSLIIRQYGCPNRE